MLSGTLSFPPLFYQVKWPSLQGGGYISGGNSRVSLLRAKGNLDQLRAPSNPQRTLTQRGACWWQRPIYPSLRPRNPPREPQGHSFLRELVIHSQGEWLSQGTSFLPPPQSTPLERKEILRKKNQLVANWAERELYSEFRGMCRWKYGLRKESI